jgi:MarR family transcriptional regulator, organic hydroperoxide resistance regulator
VRVSTAGQTAGAEHSADQDTAGSPYGGEHSSGEQGDWTAGSGCPKSASAESQDLTWLLHRAAQNMRVALDEVARAHGLTGARDWIVLTALSTGPPQTQLAMAHALGLDKTTMTSLLDRMEGRGLITRCTDSHDRRARIAVLTDEGRRVQAEVTRARDRVETSLLATFSPREQELLRELLSRLAKVATDECVKASGSCI